MSEGRGLAGVEALVFDVQGTLLDFYAPVSGALAAYFASSHAPVDVAALTNRWRETYFTGMDRVTSGERPFVPTATIYRDGLDEVLREAGREAAGRDAARHALTTVWTRLVPWPDTVDGLRRLRRAHALVALTNGATGATIAMAVRHDLGFHAVLGSDLAGCFKPDPRTYRLAIEVLALPPERIAMVASHPYDLEAARSHGLRTVFVARPREFGPRPNEARAPDGTDLSVGGIGELAARLSA